jgi:hypothetical protein
MQQSKHHCVTLYLEEEYWHWKHILMWNGQKYQHLATGLHSNASFARLCSKTIIHYLTIGWWTCALNTPGRNYWKWPTITKSKVKELTRLGEKHMGKFYQITLNIQMKMRQNIPPKGHHHQKTRNNPWGCPLQGPYFFKENEIYELNNDEDFSFVRTAKQLSWLCIFIF